MSLQRVAMTVGYDDVHAWVFSLFLCLFFFGVRCCFCVCFCVRMCRCVRVCARVWVFVFSVMYEQRRGAWVPGIQKASDTNFFIHVRIIGGLSAPKTIFPPSTDITAGKSQVMAQHQRVL